MHKANSGSRQANYEANFIIGEAMKEAVDVKR